MRSARILKEFPIPSAFQTRQLPALMSVRGSLQVVVSRVSFHVSLRQVRRFHASRLQKISRIVGL